MTTHARKLFINLPVKDLDRSMNFFSELGFSFNPQFTDDKGACMVLSDEAFVMLLRDEFFKGFTKKPVVDAHSQTEALLALSCDSREEVDRMANDAVSAGGTHAMEPQDHGFMYGRSFYDPDGHHWEVLWMDPSAIQQEQPQA